MTPPEMDGLLAGILDFTGRARWWDTPVPFFGGLTPNEMVAAGRNDEVEARIRDYLSRVDFF